MLEQAGAWARRQAAAHADLEAVGVFGSYGRGDAGVGSDLDLLLVLRQCDLPLATDLLVYSRAEWESLPHWNQTFAAVLDRDVRWLVGSGRQTGQIDGSR